jgi:hypothetical protein
MMLDVEAADVFASGSRGVGGFAVEGMLVGVLVDVGARGFFMPGEDAVS